MAIGTAALILILSIYNGFDEIIENNLSNLDPDILIRRSDRKNFEPDAALMDILRTDGRITAASCVLEERVFINYGGAQAIALAKGVDSVFEKHSPLAENLVSGKFELHFGELPQAVVGMGLARELGINTRLVESVVLYYPRSGTVSPLAGPLAALSNIKMRPAGIFSVNSEVDSELLLLPLESMRTLVGMENEVSGIELRCKEAVSPEELRKELSGLVGDEFELLDRYEQHPAIYKMMRYEKLAIYAILIFVVIIIAFNIFASLSMLIIEKREDMSQLRAMGAKESMIKRIFVLEGWMTSLLGMACGLVIGIALALLQQHFGFVRMPAGFFINSYPCILHFSDILWTVVGVAATGIIISLFSVRQNKV